MHLEKEGYSIPEKEAKAQFEAEQAAALAGEDGDSKMTPEQLREEAKREAAGPSLRDRLRGLVAGPFEGEGRALE